jgi:hypothetical protein
MLRLLAYMVRVWKRFQNEHGDSERLPVILPLVLFHGPRRWNGPADFHDLVDLPAASFAPYTPDFKARIFDLSPFGADRLVGNALVRIVGDLLGAHGHPEFEQRVTECDVVVLSDYGKGGLTHIAQMIRLARAAGKPVLVDPKGEDYARYAGATVITPNRAELRQVVGHWKDEAQLAEKSQQLRADLGLDALLVTRSEEGMTLFEAAGQTHEAALARVRRGVHLAEGQASVAAVRGCPRRPEATEHWMGGCLAAIDATTDERSFGWTNIDDMLDVGFTQSPPEKAHYLAFSLRLETRRVQPAVFKKHYQIALKAETAKAKEQGHVRLEGKEYIVQDGDILLFRFNV